MLASRRSSEPTTTEVLAELDARVVQLRERRASLDVQFRAFDAKGIQPQAPGTVLGENVDAAAMLERGEIVEPAGSPAEQMFLISRELRVIDAAITLAGQRGFRLRVAAEAELMGDVAQKWRENIRAAAMIVRKLRDLRDERERLRAEYISRTGLMFSLPCGREADLITPKLAAGDKCETFLEAVERSRY
jgi:hypothetical protein